MIDGLLAHPDFATLPVAAHLDELTPGRLVVQAPPGAGKTTVVPPALAARVDGRVIVTQPRRVAARAAARRLAALTATAPGDYAAWTVRGSSTATGGTAVEFVTTGVLLRRLLRDPGLAGVGAVILDEVHERHLDDDLALAMVSELAWLREDLTVCAMSATLDAERWAGLLGGARVVEVPSVLHPLEVRWAPMPGGALGPRGVRPEFLDHVADVTAEAVGPRPEGSALVFVPGAREVEGVVGRLTGRGLRALPLHGRLDARAQDTALVDDGRPRVVVATAVAESSLTVPGVRLVVDAGLAREPRFDQGRGVSGLVTVRESRASATQRAGRAARLGPGVVVRCLAAEDWAAMADESTPEVLVADLTDALLTLACWGSPRGEGLRLPTPLPAAAVARAEAELRATGLVDDDGRVTELGRRVGALPLEPRLGVALLAGARRCGAVAAGEVVAMLADEPSGDLAEELRRRRVADRAWRSEAARLARLAGGGGAPADAGALGVVVALARPGWVARSRGEGEYLSVSGTGLTVPQGLGLSGTWLACWDTQRSGQRVLVRAGVELSEDVALRTGLVDVERVATFDGRVRVREVRRLGAIELGSTAAPVTPDVGRPVVARALRERGLGLFTFSDDALRLRRRLALLHRVFGQPWVDVGDEALVARLDEWLAPELEELAAGGAASGVDLVPALRRLLPWPEAARLDELVPERIVVPSGSRVLLDYPDGGGAVVCAVKLQECFGMASTPEICDGRVRVLMHLLSPAGRPLAVTDDLASFWANAYPQVRAENRGRYAKHPWPEDPLTAPATRGTNRQSSRR